MSNCGYKFKKTVAIDDMLHFIDEENTVTYIDFDCSTTFYAEAPTKLGQINRGRRNISRRFEKPKCIPNNERHTCSLDGELISL